MTSLPASQIDELERQAINNFRDYLKIPSAHPNVNYDGCVKFLEDQARSLDLPLKIYELVPKKPTVVITWAGTDPNLPSILLNSHMDVVPVVESEWTHPPFSAYMDDKNIYGRGTQDIKSLGIQYLEAIRRLKQQKIKLKRTIHVSFVPDEEVGGADGMGKFAQSQDFQNLNIGWAFDEGASVYKSGKFTVFNGEKSLWYLRFHCTGSTGHGSLLLNNTAGEKVQNLVNKFYEFRRQQQQKISENPSMTINNVITVNLTKISGGVQSNVIPPELIIVFDCRIPPEEDIAAWEATVNKWCEEAGPGVWVEYEQKQPQTPITKLEDSNPYWKAFKNAADELGIEFGVTICPGATDSRYIRTLGIPSIGFFPMSNMTVLVHSTNEYLGISTFLRGIEIYCKILTHVGNVEQTI